MSKIVIPLRLYRTLLPNIEHFMKKENSRMICLFYDIYIYIYIICKLSAFIIIIFILLISRMCFICFRFCLLCS